MAASNHTMFGRAGTTPDILEGLHATLRGAALVAGLQFAWLALPSGPPRDALVAGLILFALYHGLGYWLAWRVVGARWRQGIYGLLLALDFFMAVAATRLTTESAGGSAYAIAFWVAAAGLTFGVRGGLGAAVLGYIAIAYVRPLSAFVDSPWWAAIHAGALIADGALLGLLCDHIRRRERDLREINGRLAQARKEVADEHEKLIQAEKLSSIGMLAAGVAHEINNPLSGVMGCVKALRDTEMEPQRRAEYFDVVRDGLERIQRTVRGLLDYAHRAAPDRQNLVLHEVVSACVRLLAPALRKKNITVADATAVDSPTVNANRSQLMQAMVNVLLNAIYAAPTGSSVRIGAQHNGGRVGVTVADDGDGIPEEILGRACDPFFSTKPEGEGTGLGLSVTLGIVRAHGGDLRIESGPGEGTQVTIWLPTAKGDSDARNPAG